MADEDLEALLRKKNLGEVKMTPQGFIDDAGTLYVGKHISAREHKGGRLGDFKWIELPDGSVFQIEKKVPAYGTIPGELPFNQTLADEPSRGAREIFGAEVPKKGPLLNARGEILGGSEYKLPNEGRLAKLSRNAFYGGGDAANEFHAVWDVVNGELKVPEEEAIARLEGALKRPPPHRQRTPAKEGKPPPRGERAPVGRTKGGVVSTPSSWKKPEFKKAEYPPYMSPQDRKTADAAARALAREQELRPLQGPLQKGYHGPMHWERGGGSYDFGMDRAHTQVKIETEAFQTILHGDADDIRRLLDSDDVARLFNTGYGLPPKLLDEVASLPDEELRKWALENFLESRAGELFYAEPGGSRSETLGRVTQRRRIQTTPEGAAKRVKDAVAEQSKAGGYVKGPDKQFFLKSRNYERMINAALKEGADLAPDLTDIAKKLGKVGLKGGLGVVGWGADLLIPSELGASTVGEEFRTAEEVHAAEAAAEESAAFLAEQPGYEPEGTPPAWAEPGWYEEQRFGERDLSPEGVEDARRAAAKRALEKE